MNRRQFLKLSALAGGAIAFGGPARGWWSTATAQPATVPTVDRVVMTVVVDNVYDIFAKGGKLGTITVQGAPFVRAGTRCASTVSRHLSRCADQTAGDPPRLCPTRRTSVTTAGG
jgi:nitrous oxide reductase